MTGHVDVLGASGLIYLRPSRGMSPGVRRGSHFWHQSGGTARTATAYGVGADATVNLLQEIAAVYPMASSDLGGTSTWGNTAAQSAGGTMDANTSDSAKGAASSANRIAIGISGGCGAMVNYIGKSPGHVADFAALVLILPLWDLDYHYQNDLPTGSRAAIGTAWGITHPTALPANASPKDNAALISAAAIPTRIYYATDDTICDATRAAEMVTALGAGASSISLGALGHTDAAIGAIDKPDLMAWLLSVAPPTTALTYTLALEDGDGLLLEDGDTLQLDGVT